MTAVSALRVRGVSLVIVTLAAAVAISSFYFNNTADRRGRQRLAGAQSRGPRAEPQPELELPRAGREHPEPRVRLGRTRRHAAVCVMVGYVRRGGIGLRMLAVRSNERASAAAAVNPRNVKLIAFGISSFIAGVAGALYAYNSGSVSPDRFDAFTALSLIAFAYAGGITLISGAVFAGLISTQALFPYALEKWFGVNGTYALLFGGVVLIITLLQNPEGVMGAMYKKTHRKKRRSSRPEGVRARRRRGTVQRPRTDAHERHVPCSRRRSSRSHFGGVHALHRRQPRRVRGRARRPDRPQRRRQDDVRGRDHRLRAPVAGASCSTGATSAASPRTGARSWGSRGPGRAASSSTTCSSRRTWRSPQDRSPAWRIAFRSRTDQRGDRRDAGPLRPRLGREGEPGRPPAGPPQAGRRRAGARRAGRAC